MVLSDAAVKAAKPRQKPYRLYDERGMYLQVSPQGGLYWRLKYRIGEREKVLALGVYPDVSLKRAREKRDDARRQIADGIDPSALKQATKAASADTFKAVAQEWMAKQKFAPATREKAEWTFDDLLYPYIGPLPVRDITSAKMLSVLRKLESRGKHETAHRTKQRASQVFRYAIATGRADSDPTAALRGALTSVSVKNHAAVTEPAKVGQLLRAIDSYSGQLSTEIALKLAPLLFVRPGELRKADWSEFDLDGDEPTWRIGAERMKMRRPHIVPLATQCVALLRELEPVTGPTGYVFPSLRGPSTPMSEATITAALRSLGYSGQQMTWHGFRSTASTLLNERGFAPDIIELQLAHKSADKVRATYNRAERLEERRKMMQEWADYLDELKVGKARK